MHICGPQPSVEETCSESGGDCREMKGSDAWTGTMEMTALKGERLQEKRPPPLPDARHDRMAGQLRQGPPLLRTWVRFRTLLGPHSRGAPVLGAKCGDWRPGRKGICQMPLRPSGLCWRPWGRPASRTHDVRTA